MVSGVSFLYTIKENLKKSCCKICKQFHVNEKAIQRKRSIWKHIKSLKAVQEKISIQNFNTNQNRLKFGICSKFVLFLQLSFRYLCTYYQYYDEFLINVLQMEVHCNFLSLLSVFYSSFIRIKWKKVRLFKLKFKLSANANGCRTSEKT